MMQPTLIVEGKEYQIINLTYRDGEIESASIMRNGVYTTYYDVKANTVYFLESPLKLDFRKVFKEHRERENALIDHLEDVLNKEDDELKAMAIEAMESKAEEPFALNLLDKQKEYKKAQTRVFGMIDMVEEVKAFLEGFYIKGDMNDDRCEIEDKKTR